MSKIDNTAELAQIAIDTMLHCYPSMMVTTSDVQRKNGTTQFTLRNGETFTIHTTGYVRKVRLARFGGYTCYQLNKVKKTWHTYKRLNADGRTFRDEKYYTVGRVMIPTEVERVWYLRQYLEKNRSKEIN